MRTALCRRGGEMKRGGVWVALVLLLTACVEVTPETVLPEAEMARLAVIMTATAEAERARAVEVQTMATATAESFLIESARIYATATAEAIAREDAQHAELLAREDAQRIEMATATAVAFYPTATAIAQEIVLREMEIERTRQEIVLQAREQEMALAETQRRLKAEAQREQMLFPLVTYGPWVLLAALAVLVVYGVLRAITVFEIRARAIRRDERGDAPLLVLPHGRGGIVVYDGDRAFGPATVVDADSVTMPPLVDVEQQTQVTMRDQAVDLATRGLPRTDQAGRARQKAMAQRLSMTGAPPQVRVIDAQSVRGWLNDVTPQALEMSMQEEVE